MSGTCYDCGHDLCQCDLAAYRGALQLVRAELATVQERVAKAEDERARAEDDILKYYAALIALGRQLGEPVDEEIHAKAAVARAARDRRKKAKRSTRASGRSTR